MHVCVCGGGGVSMHVIVQAYSCTELIPIAN